MTAYIVKNLDHIYGVYADKATAEEAAKKANWFDGKPGYCGGYMVRAYEVK